MAKKPRVVKPEITGPAGDQIVTDLEVEDTLRAHIKSLSLELGKVRDWGQRQHDALMETARELDTMYDRCADLKRDLTDQQSLYNQAIENLDDLQPQFRGADLPEIVTELCSRLRELRQKQNEAEGRRLRADQALHFTVRSFDRLTRMLQDQQDRERAHRFRFNESKWEQED